METSKRGLGWSTNKRMAKVHPSDKLACTIGHPAAAASECTEQPRPRRRQICDRCVKDEVSCLAHDRSRFGIAVQLSAGSDPLPLQARTVHWLR